MQKNLIIALVLSSLIYIIWFTWVVPPPKPTNQKVLQEQPKENKQTITVHQPKEVNIQSEKKQTKNHGKEYILSSNKSSYVLTQNIAIKSFIYRGPVEETDLIIEKDKPFLSILNDLNYQLISKSTTSIKVISTTKEFDVIKTLNISKDNKMNNLEIEIINKTGNEIKISPLELSLGPGLNTVKSELKENPDIWQAIYSYQREGRKNPLIEKLSSNYNMSDFLWAAIDNRYFLFAVINKNNIFKGINFSEYKINDKKAPYITLLTNEIIIKPKSSSKFEIDFYSGPKDYKLLKSFKNGLHLSVDFGFFAPLAKIANSLLKYFYSLTSNYGIAIILLRLVVQILMLPLSIKSYKAMAIMRKMQPEMKSIQERYKKDPQRMNMELMQLYRKYGANPFSGCWPMLLQIPIFFALFTTLRNSWDLHGAHFIFWIKDLSAKDPYYILPVLMGALMYLQNYITPQPTSDQAQANIMKWMPLIFTFLFLTFPSGLVIYWIVNSLFSMAQNYYLKNKLQI